MVGVRALKSSYPFYVETTLPFPPPQYFVNFFAFKKKIKTAKNFQTYEKGKQVNSEISRLDFIKETRKPEVSPKNAGKLVMFSY